VTAVLAGGVTVLGVCPLRQVTPPGVGGGVGGGGEMVGWWAAETQLTSTNAAAAAPSTSRTSSRLNEGGGASKGRNRWRRRRRTVSGQTCAALACALVSGTVYRASVRSPERMHRYLGTVTRAVDALQLDA
jgi:hypothetical protein